jgi:hypothetical protein
MMDFSVKGFLHAGWMRGCREMGEENFGGLTGILCRPAGLGLPRDETPPVHQRLTARMRADGRE